MLEYEIQKDWMDVINKVDEIGKVLREDAVSKSFNPRGEYERMLRILSGCYAYLVTEFKKWRAIKENNEVAKYCQLKSEQTVKFVSAQAEREASLFVAKERYNRDLLEGWVLGCEQMIHTLKKFIETDKQEEKFS
jgi:hypothetical protein